MIRTIKLDTEKAAAKAASLVKDILPGVTAIDEYALAHGAGRALEVLPDELLAGIIVQRMADESIKSLQDETVSDVRRQANKKFKDHVSKRGMENEGL